MNLLKILETQLNKKESGEITFRIYKKLDGKLKIIFYAEGTVKEIEKRINILDNERVLNIELNDRDFDITIIEKESDK